MLQFLIFLIYMPSKITYSLVEKPAGISCRCHKNASSFKGIRSKKMTALDFLFHTASDALPLHVLDLSRISVLP